MYFDDLLTDYLGEIGRYQIFLFCGIASISFASAYNTMGIVFITAVPEHWCDVPSLSNITSLMGLSTEQYRNITAPQGESCKMYNASYATWGESDITRYLSEGPPAADVVNCLHGMAYSDEVYKSTVTSEWDLVCGNDVIRATTSSVYMAGFMFGVIITGILSDIVGRRPVFLVCLVMSVLASIAVSFSPNVIVFCVLRFLVAFFNIGAYTTGFVVAMEIVGVKWRMHAGVAFMYFWAAGYLLYALYAYFIRSWRTLYLVTSSTLVLLFVLIPILPESPRWLYSRQNNEKADKIVKKIAKYNNKELPHPINIEIKTEKRGYIWDLVRTPRLRLRTFNVMFNWFVNSFVYYGLSLNSSNLGGNDLINFAISGGVEVPAYIFCQIVLAHFGRRLPLSGTMVIGGIALLAIIPLPENLHWLAVTLAMVGKFCITASFSIIYLLTAEVYPTVTRHVGVATGSLFARVGGLTAPYVGLLDRYGSWVPMVIYGSFSILAGLLALAFPETKDKKLPETIEEGEAFGLKIKTMDSQEKFPDQKYADQGNGLTNPGFKPEMEVVRL